MDTIELLAEISVLKKQLKNSVEVVRCEDCEHYRTAKINMINGNLICQYTGMEMVENDYCSRGERRSE